jgi:hypothetical protein
MHKVAAFQSAPRTTSLVSIAIDARLETTAVLAKLTALNE